MTHIKNLITPVAMAALISMPMASHAGKPVNIDGDLGMAVSFSHGGKSHTIERNQDNDNTINPDFAKTSRPCPPFCIQPAILAPGIETIAEIEVINYVKAMADGDDSILVIDSRTPAWVTKGTIPGAVNIPWTALSPAKGADPISIGEIMEDSFGANQLEGLWDYSSVKTLVMFCNGMWCGQSPNNIKTLLKFGYPAHKIKWYRGGMQSWNVLGLSTTKP
ncbi:MAG TPA: rhodanese-like domain-containing protein [Chromatiaceae bacterium]|jgi:rhodanese-related sulfurtransferase|nr:rhodanese-like domain-containing protein [Chromatiaceae bacterium]HIB84062.1 rhodanese-like domain-containing protein [Chromatiaceae bacterium]HIN81866.1 rhodanese-like domain-containing protein [Chromatiales bacterium]HIO54310.1 rhodanese-like domain-containing protein [Chromatiales bacterium]